MPIVELLPSVEVKHRLASSRLLVTRGRPVRGKGLLKRFRPWLFEVDMVLACPRHVVPPAVGAIVTAVTGLMEFAVTLPVVGNTKAIGNPRQALFQSAFCFSLRLPL